MRASVALDEHLSMHPALRAQLKRKLVRLAPLRPVGDRLYRVSCSHIQQCQRALTLDGGLFCEVSLALMVSAAYRDSLTGSTRRGRCPCDPIRRLSPS